MSEQNVARLRPVLAEWERGDFTAGTDIISPDVVLSAFNAPERTVVCHGWEEIRRYLREFLTTWRSYRIEVDRLTPLDDLAVLLEGRQRGVGKGSGVETVDSLYIVFQFDRDQIVAMHWHVDRDGALEAAGLSE